MVQWRGSTVAGINAKPGPRPADYPPVTSPGFVAFLNQQGNNDHVEFPSPVDDSLLLSARIAPYGKKQRLLLVTDISRVRRLEQMRREFVTNVSRNCELRSR